MDTKMCLKSIEHCSNLYKLMQSGDKHFWCYPLVVLLGTTWVVKSKGVLGRPTIFLFVVRSDSDAGGPDDCCNAQEVRQWSIKFDPHCCVSRPGLCWKVLADVTELQQVLYCHWRFAAGAHCSRCSTATGDLPQVHTAAGALLSLEICRRCTLQQVLYCHWRFAAGAHCSRCSTVTGDLPQVHTAAGALLSLEICRRCTLQQVLYCHWRFAAGAHCRMVNR